MVSLQRCEFPWKKAQVTTRQTVSFERKASGVTQVTKSRYQCKLEYQQKEMEEKQRVATTPKKESEAANTSMVGDEDEFEDCVDEFN